MAGISVDRGGRGVGLLKRRVRWRQVKLTETGDAQVSGGPCTGRGVFSMLGQRQGAPGWLDDPMQ